MPFSGRIRGDPRKEFAPLKVWTCRSTDLRASKHVILSEAKNLPIYAEQA
jgi:hypothetical protein